MKMKLFFLAVLCQFFLLSSVIGYSQTLLSPSSMRTYWDSRTSNLLTMAILQFPEARAALEISDEQYELIQSAPLRGMQEMQKHPETLATTEEMKALFEQSGFRPPSFGGYILHPKDFDDETWERIQALQRKTSLLQKIVLSDAHDGILTSEQQQKMNEALLANMEGFPVVSLSRFDGLNLTDAQREQMKNLEKELEPEFEKFLENFTKSHTAFSDRIHSILQEQEGESLHEKMRKADVILSGNAEFKRLYGEFQSLQEAFGARLLTEIGERNILTGAQWSRLQELFDNPPEHAMVLRRALSGQSGESGGGNGGGNASGGADVWQPGPDAWRPGDAIPVQYRQERNSRFPRGAE